MSEQQVCGMCGKPLSECHIGPCPWGVPERPVLANIAGYETQLPCLMDRGLATSCADCLMGHRYDGICTDDDGPLASQTDDTIYGFNGQAIVF